MLKQLKVLRDIENLGGVEDCREVRKNPQMAHFFAYFQSLQVVE